MPDNDPNRTRPQTPPAAEPVADTVVRSEGNGSANSNRTADHVPVQTPGTGTVARTPADVARLEEGTRARAAEGVPGYMILRELGRGGMGVVYEARHVKLNRIVALKMMLGGEQAGRSNLIRFLAEAEAVAAVKHENVVQVYDYGEHAGTPFMALEFCSGGSLAGVNKGDPLAPGEAAALVEKIADGVAAAHDQGIVHRDLKPGNVLLDATGEPKVADFGLAKRGAGDDLTRTGQMMGTPAYMAPEQAGGGAKFVGPAADVWALGVMLYESLVGERPFRAESIDGLLAKILLEEPIPPRKVAPELPRDLDLICRKCLEKSPTDRYPTARELAADLERFRTGRPIGIRPAGLLERAYKWARRKPSLAAFYALALVAVALVGFGTTVAVLLRATARALETAKDERSNAVSAREGEEVARGKAESAREGEATARKIAEDGEKQMAVFKYGWTMQVAYQEWRDNNAPRALALLEQTDPRLRGWEWDYVHRLCHSDLVTFRGHTGAVNDAAFSPDGALVATGSGDRMVKVWNAKTGTEIHTLVGHTAFVESVSFSPDGSRIVSGDRNLIAKVWDTKTGAEVHTLKGPPGRDNAWNVLTAAFSPDGTRVWAWDGLGTAKEWDAATGTELRTFKSDELLALGRTSRNGSRVMIPARSGVTVRDEKSGTPPVTCRGHTGTVWSVAFSPDRSFVATASADMTARVWDPKTGAELLTLKGHTGWVKSAVFSTDGTQILTASWDGTAKLWDAKRGTDALTLRGPPDGRYENGHDVRSAALSSDGRWVVTGEWDDHSATLWDANTGGKLKVFKHRDMTKVESVAFSPDGARIVTGSIDGTTRVWDIATGAVLSSFSGQTAGAGTAAFSRDGSKILSGCADATAKLWDVKTGAATLTLRGHTGAVGSAVFSPDGSRIVTASADRTAKVWDAKTGQSLLTLTGHPAAVLSASFNRNGSRLVTLSEGVIRLWDATTGVELFTLKGHTSLIWSARFNPDGSRIVTASYDGTIKLWDPTTGAELFTLKGHTAQVWSACFSSDGSRIVTAGHDGTARVWDSRPTSREFLAKGDPAQKPPLELSGQLLARRPGLTTVMFSRDGSRAVVGGFDGTALLWDVAARKELQAFKGHGSHVWTVALSPDGKTALTGGQDNTVRFWDTASGRERHKFAARAIFSCVRFSPDGDRAAATNWDGKVRVWKMPGAVPAGEFAYDTPALDLAFTPDGKRFVLGTASGRVLVCDSTSGAVEQTLAGHAGVVHGVAVIGDGKQVLSAGHDQTIRRWDVKTGRAEKLYLGHWGAVNEIRLLPDGRRFVSGGDDRALRLWDLETGREAGRGSSSGGVRGLSVSPDGKSCLTAGMDGTLCAWEIPSR